MVSLIVLWTIATLMGIIIGYTTIKPYKIKIMKTKNGFQPLKDNTLVTPPTESATGGDNINIYADYSLTEEDVEQMKMCIETEFTNVESVWMQEMVNKLYHHYYVLLKWVDYHKGDAHKAVQIIDSQMRDMAKLKTLLGNYLTHHHDEIPPRALKEITDIIVNSERKKLCPECHQELPNHHVDCNETSTPNA